MHKKETNIKEKKIHKQKLTGGKENQRVKRLVLRVRAL